MRVPYPYIKEGLSPVAAQQLARNFAEVELTADPGISDAYDAIVDGSLTADDVGSLRFKTVWAAVKYVADTLGIVRMSIGFVMYPGAAPTVTEVEDYSGTTGGLRVRVGLVGGTPLANVQAGTEGTWDWAGFHENSKMTFIAVNGLRVTTSRTALCASTTMTMQFNNSTFTGGGTTPDLPFTRAYNSQFNSAEFLQGVYAVGCTFILGAGITNTFASSGSSIVELYDCYISAASQAQVNIGAQHPVISNVRTYLITMALTGTRTAYVSSVAGSPTATTSSPMTLTITSSLLKQAHISGVFTALTVNTTGGAGGTIIVSGQVLSTAVIHGPATIDLGIGEPATTYGSGGYMLSVFGAGVTGSVAFYSADTSSSPAGAALRLNSTATRCTLTASYKRNGAVSTGDFKHYDIDAAAANNTIVFEGDAVNGTSVNASATTLIIDHTLGAAGPAGGDLTGTYPNPTLATAGPGATGPIGDGATVPVVTIDAKGRVTALTSTAITPVIDEGLLLMGWYTS